MTFVIYLLAQLGILQAIQALITGLVVIALLFIVLRRS